MNPSHDPDFAKEQPEAQAEVNRLLPIVREIAANPHLLGAVSMAAEKAGVSSGTMRRLYIRWCQLGWVGLIDRRKFPLPKKSK